MPNYLPESEELDIRDYLFVDRQRIGSLLSQFSDGLPSDRSATQSRSARIRAGFPNIFDLDRHSDSSETQSLALADLHVSQLEEDAQAVGLLADVSELVAKRKNWLRGKVRRNLKPGMMLRITAATQISDMSTIIDKFDTITGAWSGGLDQDFSELLNQIESLYGESISITIRTTADSDSSIAFIGEIPHDHEFGPMKRNLLLSQIGPDPVELTTLMQIAAVPTERDSEIPIEDLLSSLTNGANNLVSENRLDRTILDELMAKLAALLAQSGFVAAPRWPAISVIPLAIYRNIQRIPALDEDDKEFT